MTEKLVSVVIPTYKGSDVITRAVDSVLEQTYPNFEIIVVDDNAPNMPERIATEEVMHRYDDNKSVVYLKHETNRNGAAARNTGIHFSHGLYIAFLDDDDWFLPEKIEEQVRFLNQHEQFKACYCLAQRDGKPIQTIPYTGDVSKELLMMKSRMFTPSLCFRKEALLAINGFDESFRRHQDYELLLRFFQKGFKIGCVEKVLVELGTGAGNNNPNGDKLLGIKNNFLKSFEPFINLIDKSTPGIKKKIYALHYGKVFVQFIIEHQFRKALNLTSQYFFLSPSYFMLPMFQKVIGYLCKRIKMLFKKGE